MSESLAERQRRLSSEISRQRTELGVAYQNLAKPLLYTEYAMRGFGVLRQNPWIFSVIPAASSIVSLAAGLIRGRSSQFPQGKREGKFFAREAKRDAEKAATLGLGGLAMKWGGRGWKLFRLYGRLRKYLS